MTVRVGVVGSGFMGRTWAEVAAHQATGTSLVAVTGGQRFAEPHELAYQDPDKVANVGTRAEELQQWRELGFHRMTAGIPGLQNTDEGFYEFIEDCRTAGIDWFDRQEVPA